MSVLYITEFSQAGIGENGVPLQAANQLPLAEQAVTFTTSAQSAVLNASTRLVRLQADGICSILFGPNPTATTSNMRMTAGQTEYFTVGGKSGLKIAAVTNT